MKKEFKVGKLADLQLLPQASVRFAAAGNLFLKLIAFLGLLVGTTAVLIPNAHAETINVNTVDDELNSDGDCSLREAVVAANTNTAVDGCTAGDGSDIISVPPGTYMLSLAGAGEDAAQTGDLDLTADVTITGAGMFNTIIDGGGLDRIFDVQNDATVNITGITAQNGAATQGAGLNIGFGSSLTLNQSRATDNAATNLGGGIFVSGSLTLSESRVDGNDSSSGGGGVLNFGTVTIRSSDISGNSTGGQGGGIYNSGNLVLVNSTLSSNSADSDGGGIHAVESNNNRLYNVTITANTADANADDTGNGGGVSFLSGGVVANTLIGGNSDNSPGTVRPDCSGTLTSEGYNLITNVTGCTINGDTTGNLIGVDPELGGLQNNGGSSFTHALQTGSPAIDAGNPGGCLDQNDDLLTDDQRGFSRPGGSSDRCDIGAYESGAIGPAPTPSATPIVTPTATPVLDKFIYLPVTLKQ